MAENGWTRRQLLRNSAVVGLTAAPVFVAGCTRVDPEGDAEGGLLARIKKRGYITIGISGEVPAAYMKGGKLAGRDPAIHKAIWEAVGIEEVRGVQVSFDQLIPGLNANRFDVVAVGMFILPDRCDQAAFSDPEFFAPEAFLVKKGNPAEISDYSSVAKADIRLGVLPGAVEGIYARKSGVPNAKIVEVASQRDGLVALKAGRVQALSLTYPALRWMLKTKPDPSLELTKPFVPVVDGEKKYGVGGSVFRKENKRLRAAFNRELAKLRRSGKLKQIVDPLGYESKVPQGITTAALCKATD